MASVYPQCVGLNWRSTSEGVLHFCTHSFSSGLAGTGKELDGVKVLGGGELTKKLTVTGCSYSESAKAKIEAVGGTAE